MQTNFPQTRKTFAKVPGSTKTSKYFTQSFNSSQLDYWPPKNQTSGVSEYLTKMNQRSMYREYSPKPDYNSSAHIRVTTCPQVQPRQIKPGYLYERGFEQNNSIEKSNKQHDSKSMKTAIKIQQADTTAENLLSGQYSNEARNWQSNRIENQLKYSRANTAQDTARKYSQSIDMAITPPIKLRDLKDHQRYDDNRSNLSIRNTTQKKSKQKVRQREEFDSNMSQYSRQLQYSKVVTKTLQQTIDQNVQLKMDYELLKDMHKQSIKTITFLQQLIMDKMPVTSTTDTNKLASRQFKDVYEKIAPYQHINKIIKPSLQAELQIYREKQYERQKKVKKDLKMLEDQIIKMKEKQIENSRENQFLRNQNIRLRTELREIKQNTIQASQPKTTVELQKCFTFDDKCNQDKTEISVIPETLSNHQTQNKGRQSDNQEINTSSKQANDKSTQYISRMDFQKILNEMQKITSPQLSAAQNMVAKLDQRCKQLEVVIDKMLQQRRSEKERKAVSSQNKKVNVIEADVRDMSDNSQILTQSKLSHISSKTKSGIGMIKMTKYQGQKSTNTPNIINNAGVINTKDFQQKQELLDRKPETVNTQAKITQNKEIQIRNSKLEQEREQMIQEIRELKQKLVRAENLRSSYEEQRQGYRNKLRTVYSKLRNVRERIIVCNMDNFEFLINEFVDILEEKKHLALKVMEHETSQPKKVWQLQKQLNEVRKKKQQLVQRCLNLQKYIQENINEGKSTSSLIIDGLYDHYFSQNQQQSRKCVCVLEGLEQRIDEDQGKCALEWVKYLHCTMVEIMQDIDMMISSSVDENI